MTERQKNTILGAVAFGLGFTLLQLFLSIDLDPFAYLGKIIGVLVLTFFSITIVGALVGFIFGINSSDQRKLVWSGVRSFGLIAGFLLLVTVALAALLFYSLAYVLEYSSPAQDSLAIWLKDGIPYQFYGALFGILSGLITGSIFGRGRSPVFRIILWGVLGFGLGGFLMGWFAPIDTYLGFFNPIGFFRRLSPSAFLLNRMIGGVVFGLMGGGTLAYFLDAESENN